MIRVPLNMELPDELLKLASIFESAGHKLFVVGGAVRDAVMGSPPKDFDVATDATPEQIRELLVPLGYNLLNVGVAFGVTVVVLPHPLEKLEIATFREDLTAGRHPEVRFATINEDVQRRDLTINALFYDISTGEVVDLVGGLTDIGNRVIRTVGRPEDRFAEDRLRILRAFRFSSRFSFPIDVNTHNAIVNDNNLAGVSPERIRDEFVRGIASAKHVRQFLLSLDSYHMFPRIFPGLKVNRCPDVMVSSAGPDSRNVSIVLAVLLSENERGEVMRVLNALKYTASEIAVTLLLMQLVNLTVENAYTMRKRFDQLNIDEDVVLEFARERGSPVGPMLQAFLEYKTTVSGDDLLAQGFSGPAVGREMVRRETELFRAILEKHLPQ